MTAVVGERAWRAAARHPWPLDVACSAALTGYTILWGLHYTPPDALPFDALAVALTVAANLTTAFRRRAPVAVLLVCVAALVAFVACGYWASLNGLGPMLALYSVAAQRGLRTTLAGAAVLFPAMQYGLTSLGAGAWWTLLGQSVTLTAVPAVLGGVHRALRDRNRRLRVLTAQLEREQAAREQRAVTEERLRLARELHDVVAHHMSVVSVQAGLATYVFDRDPGAARAALGTAEAASREALEETRRLLEVLRPGESAFRPAPGLDGLGELAERVRHAGVPVELAVEGPRRPLPPGVELCAYRAVQEALTNVIRHARPASARVVVGYLAERLEVRVTDDGRAALPSPAQDASGGRGLAGMLERARLYGGTLDAGRRAGAGFEVRLSLPIPAVPAREEVA